MYFPTNIFVPTPKITPKPHFEGPFNAKPIIHRALRKSHVNGATKLKLYCYRQVLGEWVVSKFFRQGRPGAHGPLMQIWDPRIISETTGAR